MKIRVTFRYFVNDWKHFLDSKSPQTPSDLIHLSTLTKLQGLSHSFNLKLEHLICKKVLKFDLLANCFSDLFTEVKIWH